MVNLGTDEFHSRMNHHIVSLDHRVIATIVGMVKWKPLKLHPTLHPKVTNKIISQIVMEGGVGNISTSSKTHNVGVAVPVIIPFNSPVWLLQT